MHPPDPHTPVTILSLCKEVTLISVSSPPHHSPPTLELLDRIDHTNHQTL